MPVIRRRDQDGVHVLAREQGVIVACRERLRLRELLGQLQVRLIDIAQRHHARVGHFRERPHEMPAAPAGADQANVDTLVRPDRLRRGGKRQRRRCSDCGDGSGDEFTARDGFVRHRILLRQIPRRDTFSRTTARFPS